jgi:very-short-patch-repair endonuclease
MVKLKNELVKGNRSLAEQITIDLLRFKFKKLKVLTNDKTAIGKELDIFLPDFKIAIEIDGIFHQRIVYSEKSFEATKKNDLRKNILLFRIPLPEDSRTYYTFLKKEILENIAPAISNIINAPTIS